jgi:hypothetical protein
MMKPFPLIGILIVTVLAIGHADSLNAALQSIHENNPGETNYSDLKRAIHKNQADVERFGELLDELNDASHDSNNAHRQTAVGQILYEMVQEIRLVHKSLEKNYYLPGDAAPDEACKSGPAPEDSAVVLRHSHSRLAAMEEIYRACNQMQEPAIQKQGHALKDFMEKSQEFYGVMRDEYRFTCTLLPATYREAGSNFLN